VLGFGDWSCFEDNIDSSEDLLEPAAAHEVPGKVRELLGVEDLGRGGTAYAVCLEIGVGGAPVGRACLDVAPAAVVAMGPGGLKDFDFWILEMNPALPFFLFRKR
jgi:hypothetical protein